MVGFVMMSTETVSVLRDLWEHDVKQVSRQLNTVKYCTYVCVCLVERQTESHRGLMLSMFTTIFELLTKGGTARRPQQHLKHVP